MDYSKKDSIRDFWNERAGLGKWAGTQDVIAKEIEMIAISKYISDGMTIIEAGCGNGISAIQFARSFEVKIVGTDFAESMVEQANELARGQDLRGSVSFDVMDILNIGAISHFFDMAYTERVIINLMEWDIQKRAIENIVSLLKPGGIFVMCENSQDGLDEINNLRQSIGLDPYQAPWHNRYLRDEEIMQLSIPGASLETVDYYSSTYYLLSRVVNAAVAKDLGKEPEYDSFINRLALKLPAIGCLGQGRIWVWRKAKD